MSRTSGIKNSVKLPSRYEIGNSAVNFWLAILGQAKKDFHNWHYAKEMVKAFVKHRGTTPQHFLNPKRRGRRNIDPLEEAWWVVEYVNERWSG